MASNDPTDTGGLFIGRRPGTAPLRLRVRPKRGSQARQRFDSALAALILVAETLVLVTLWGPQPVAWLWVGSQVDYLTGSVEAGILAAFAGMIATLFLTLRIARSLDVSWRIVRRAAGHDQKDGAIERIFIASVGIGLTLFLFYFLIIQGPGSQFVSPQV